MRWTWWKEMNSTSVFGTPNYWRNLLIWSQTLFESDSLRALRVGAFREGTVENASWFSRVTLFTEVPFVPTNTFFCLFFSLLLSKITCKFWLYFCIYPATSWIKRLYLGFRIKAMFVFLRSSGSASMRHSSYNPKLVTDMVKDRAYCSFTTASVCGYFAQPVLNCSAKERSRCVHFGQLTRYHLCYQEPTSQCLYKSRMMLWCFAALSFYIFRCWTTHLCHEICF